MLDSKKFANPGCRSWAVCVRPDDRQISASSLTILPTGIEARPSWPSLLSQRPVPAPTRSATRSASSLHRNPLPGRKDRGASVVSPRRTPVRPVRPDQAARESRWTRAASNAPCDRRPRGRQQTQGPTRVLGDRPLEIATGRASPTPSRGNQRGVRSSQEDGGTEQQGRESREVPERVFPFTITPPRPRYALRRRLETNMLAEGVALPRTDALSSTAA